MNNSKILIIGPNCQGGVSSVINFYKNYGLDANYLSSYKRNNVFFQMVFFPLFLFRYTALLLINRNIKIVHIHAASYGSFIRKSIVLKIAKLFKKKVIFHIHGAEFHLFYDKSPEFMKKIITNTLNQADLIIVLSKVWKERISRICERNKERKSKFNLNLKSRVGLLTHQQKIDNALIFAPGEYIKVLYNPICIKEINHTSSEQVRFLFMGRIEKRKGVYDIIEAVKNITNPNIIINLYGDGDLDKFKALIEESNLQDKIKISDWVSGDEKDEAYKNSDVLLLPSYNEGLPMSILEAMAYGLPIIATTVGGIPEAVEDGVNGFLIQPGDTKTLAERIDLLASYKDLREKMGRAGYDIAKEKFDIKIIINQLQDIYDGMLK